MKPDRPMGRRLAGAPAAGRPRAAGPRAPRRAAWLGVGVAAAVGLAVAALAARDGGGRPSPRAAAPAGPSGPVVGADLHSLVVEAGSGRLFVGGHQAVATSADGGRTWSPVGSLDGADAMGWGFGGSTIWVSGHPGLNRSDDGGRTFRRANQGLPNTDVHAFGASGSRLYGASPAVGVFASDDAGATWEVRTDREGRSFFGRILVDPAEPAHLVAADVRAGPVESRDGGRTWRHLGGVGAAAWVSWAGGDPARLVASGPSGAARSADGGRNWERLDVPAGARLVEAAPAADDLLYAAGLEDGRAALWVSRDRGRTWARP